MAVGSDTVEGSGENETATESTEEEEEVISEEAVYSMNSEDGLTQARYIKSLFLLSLSYEYV